MQFKPEGRPQSVSEWKREFELPYNPIRKASEVEKQITQPGTQALAKEEAKKAERKAAGKKPGKVTFVLLLLLVLIGTGIYYQDVLLNQQQQWRQNSEIETLLTAAQAEQPPGDKALANYRRVLQIHPNNAEARLGLQSITSQLVANARDEIKAGDFSAAENTLAKATAILPDATIIKLASDDLEQAKVTHKNNQAREKLRAEQRKKAIKKAREAADKGQVTETFALIEQARILDAEEQAINNIKSHLRVALETRATLMTSRARQAMKNKDTKAARQHLLRAKEINAQLEKLHLPETEISRENEIRILLNVATSAANEGDIDLALEKFAEARSLGGGTEAIRESKNQLKAVLEAQATKAAAEAQQAMKDKNKTLAKTSLKKVKDIKQQLEQLK